MKLLIKNLEDSLYKGFIDQNKHVSSHFKPKLLTNTDDDNVLSNLLQQLNKCNSFIFSVAFITEGGLATLKSILHDLNLKGIKGRILTSTFLNFNNPKIFKELLKISNIEVKLSDAKGFHSKGYIFENEDHYSLIVGSSNLTDSALKTNFEWNVLLTSLENGEVIHHFKNQFEKAWEEAAPLTEEWIAVYQQNYNFEFSKQLSSQVVRAEPLYTTNNLAEALKVTPNKMQQEALTQIKILRESGAKKGLIISATGTGKTYLSAFDVRNFGPKTMLFIVHREQILKKAMSDFRKILGGNPEDFGILSSNSRDTSARYLFATIQTISRDAHLQQFAKDHFDYILIDEVHRAGADSYLKVIDYFTPQFMLGMTATPERTDNFNIYEIFDYNIAYEIRLQAALEEDMLCPFHYFGVTDYEIDGKTIDETTHLQHLVRSERVDHIIEKISYYGFSGERVKGLMFCSSVEEARELSNILNMRGYKTDYLTGAHTQAEREKAIEQLEKGEIQYILTVDIFNEGIDIPFINQIVMLRQTQSSIIFIQQLGRGLRKHDSKEYVTIIDFIGNYKNNYLIPTALSGDKSLNKDNVRRNTVNTQYIKGVSTVNFEEIAKKRIFNAIANTNLSTLKTLRDAYQELKNRTNKIPLMTDFIAHHSIDPEVIFTLPAFDNYSQFLSKIEPTAYEFTAYENSVLSMFTREFLNGKRVHELILIQLLLTNEKVSKNQYIQTLKDASTYYDEATLQSVENIFTLQFQVQKDAEKYGNQSILDIADNMYGFNTTIKASLLNSDFKLFVEDIVECGFIKSKNYDLNKPLTLYQKYSRRDVCRLLNWASDSSSTIYGYRTKHDTTPLFVTYHKTEDVEASQAYENEFLAADMFKWFSRNRLTTHSPEVKEIIHHREKNNKIHLFIKKNDADGRDFYYLGTTEVIHDSVQDETMPDKNGRQLPVVTMNMLLEQPVKYEIYHYLVEE